MKVLLTDDLIPDDQLVTRILGSLVFHHQVHDELLDVPMEQFSEIYERRVSLHVLLVVYRLRCRVTCQQAKSIC